MDQPKNVENKSLRRASPFIYTVFYFERFDYNSHLTHWSALKYLLYYLKETSNYKLIYIETMIKSCSKPIPIMYYNLSLKLRQMSYSCIKKRTQ